MCQVNLILDVAMHPLSVMLNSITVNTPNSPSTVIVDSKEDLIQTFNQTPGLRALDLGAGLVASSSRSNW